MKYKNKSKNILKVVKNNKNFVLKKNGFITKISKKTFDFFGQKKNPVFGFLVSYGITLLSKTIKNREKNSKKKNLINPANNGQYG